MRFAGGTNGSETTRIREFGPGFFGIVQDRVTPFTERLRAPRW